MSDLYTDKNLELKKSRNGLGVFTKKKYKAGDMVLEVNGPFITCNVEDDIDYETRSNAFRYNDDLFINANGNFAFYLNHSCIPNSKIIKKSKKLFVIAINNINKGEEVVFDYSTIIANDDVWAMRCNCGETDCRKKIQKFSKLPKYKKEDYIKNKIVPNFILKI